MMWITIISMHIFECTNFQAVRHVGQKLNAIRQSNPTWYNIWIMKKSIFLSILKQLLRDSGSSFSSWKFERSNTIVLLIRCRTHNNVCFGAIRFIFKTSSRSILQIVSVPLQLNPYRPVKNTKIQKILLAIGDHFRNRTVFERAQAHNIYKHRCGHELAYCHAHSCKLICITSGIRITVVRTTAVRCSANEKYCTQSRVTCAGRPSDCWIGLG